jgi:hypothetical protein
MLSVWLDPFCIPPAGSSSSRQTALVQLSLLRPAIQAYAVIQMLIKDTIYVQRLPDGEVEPESLNIPRFDHQLRERLYASDLLF